MVSPVADGQFATVTFDTTRNDGQPQILAGLFNSPANTPVAGAPKLAALLSAITEDDITIEFLCINYQNSACADKHRWFLCSAEIDGTYDP
jgi:hypothetical protein